jgi:hypothetical protein
VKVVVRFFRNVASRFGTAGGMLSFFWRRKIWWLVPLVFVLLLVGVSSFIYTLF